MVRILWVGVEGLFYPPGAGLRQRWREFFVFIQVLPVVGLGSLLEVRWSLSAPRPGGVRKERLATVEFVRVM